MCPATLLVFEGGAFDQLSGALTHSGRSSFACGQRSSSHGRWAACHTCARAFSNLRDATGFRHALHHIVGLMRPLHIAPPVIAIHSRLDSRRLLNAEQLRRALVAEFALPVRIENDLGKMPMREQVQIISSAGIAISSHGAGTLPLALFMPTGGILVELFRYTRLRCFYEQHGVYAGLAAAIQWCQSEYNGPWVQNGSGCSALEADGTSTARGLAKTGAYSSDDIWVDPSSLMALLSLPIDQLKQRNLYISCDTSQPPMPPLQAEPGCKRDVKHVRPEHESQQSHANSSTPALTLVTGWIPAGKEQNVATTHAALNASASCWARVHNFGIVTVRGEHRDLRSWPYGHYIKAVALLEHLQLNEEAKMAWMLWTDADIRPLSYNRSWASHDTLGAILREAERRNAHIIVTAQKGFCKFINNAFLVRHSEWARWFLRIWTAIMRSGPLGGGTCGFFDQCPFAWALLNLIENHGNYSSAAAAEAAAAAGNFSGLEKGEVIPKALRRLAPQRDASLNGFSERMRTLGVPCDSSEPYISVGPVLFVRTWRGGAWTPSHEVVSSSRHEVLAASSLLTLEPARALEELAESPSSWPVAIHAKYSLMCRTAPLAMQRAFRQRYIAAVRMACTPDEQQLILGANGPCWATGV